MLSTADIRLRRVIQDMVCVLNIPGEEDPTPDQGARQSFKKRTGPAESRA